ncbi:MAG: protein kinase [Kofleriaceae bacterium]
MVAPPLADASGPRLAPGLRVGGYELTRSVGRGGMGEVFQARDLTLGRRVAVKFLTSEADDMLARRFVIEARTTARCVHENIVVIHEVSSWQGLPYMVLEYLEGETLAAILRRQLLPPARVIDLLTPVARALICAHEAGIIHRDLKPDNVFVTTQGVVKVLDFGIAKLLGVVDGDEASQRDIATIAQVDGGRMVGTVPYMAPEQWVDGAVDARTDLYAFGVIAFRALAGGHPCGGTTRAAVEAAARDTVHAYRPLSAVVPSVPEALAIVVDRCLRKRPEDRFQSAADLVRALEELDPRGRRRPADDACPYPGLAGFTEDDADRYFGRAQDVRRGLDALRTKSLVAVVGHSGSGKSSFVRAGLVAGVRDDGPGWEVVTVRPGPAPLAALVEALARVPGLAVPLDGAAQLSAAPGRLGTWLRAWCKASGQRILLVIDQLEELFTLAADVEVREAWVMALVACVDDPAEPIRAVVTLRSDFLQGVAAYPRLAELVVRGTLLLSPLDRGGLRAALTGPLGLTGYRFEDTAMVEEIVGAFEGEAHALPMLQAVAHQLWSWRDQRARVIPRAAVASIGGVAGALARHANAVVGALPEQHQQVAQAIFLRLVTAQGTRVAADRAALESLDPAAPLVMLALIEARLVVARDDAATVELVHEVLITGWPVLVDWLRSSLIDRATRERVSNAATAWVAHGRADDLLWAGEALAGAEQLARRGQVALSPIETAFVGASVAARNRSRRRRRAAIAAGLTVAIAVAVASMLALALVRRAERGATAEARRATAEAARSLAAERALAEKIQALEEAERQRAAAAEASGRAQEVASQRALVEQGEEALRAALEEARALLGQRNAALAKERTLREDLEAALAREQANVARERARAEVLERRRSKIIGDLAEACAARVGRAGGGVGGARGSASRRRRAGAADRRAGGRTIAAAERGPGGRARGVRRRQPRVRGQRLRRRGRAVQDGAGAVGPAGDPLQPGGGADRARSLARGLPAPGGGARARRRAGRSPGRGPQLPAPGARAPELGRDHLSGGGTVRARRPRDRRRRHRAPPRARDPRPGGAPPGLRHRLPHAGARAGRRPRGGDRADADRAAGGAAVVTGEAVVGVWHRRRGGGAGGHVVVAGQPGRRQRHRGDHQPVPGRLPRRHPARGAAAARPGSPRAGRRRGGDGGGGRGGGDRRHLGLPEPGPGRAGAGPAPGAGGDWRASGRDPGRRAVRFAAGLAVAILAGAAALGGCNKTEYTTCEGTVCPVGTHCACDVCVAETCADGVLDPDEECDPGVGGSTSCYSDVVQYGDYGRVECAATCEFDTAGCGVFGYVPERQPGCLIQNPTGLAAAADALWVATGRSLLRVSGDACVKLPILAIKQVVAVPGAAVVETEPAGDGSNYVDVVDGTTVTRVLTDARASLGEGVAISPDAVVFGRSGARAYVIERTAGSWAGRVATVACDAASAAPAGMRIDAVLPVPGADWVVLGMRRTAAPQVGWLAVVSKAQLATATTVDARCLQLPVLDPDAVYLHGVVTPSGLYLVGTGDTNPDPLVRAQRLAVVRLAVADTGEVTGELVLAPLAPPPIPLPSSPQVAWAGGTGELMIAQNSTVVSYLAGRWFVPPSTSERVLAGLAPADGEDLIATPGELMRSRGNGYRVFYDCRQEPGAITSCEVLTAGVAGGSAWALVEKRPGRRVMRDGVEQSCDAASATACEVRALGLSATQAWSVDRRGYADGHQTFEVVGLTDGTRSDEVTLPSGGTIEQAVVGPATVAVLTRGAMADDPGTVWVRPTAAGRAAPTPVVGVEGRVDRLAIVPAPGGDAVVALVEAADGRWTLQAIVGAATWSVALPTPGRPRAVAGGSLAQLWVVGDNGRVLACASTGCEPAWQALGTDASLTAIAGADGPALYVGGTGNALFQYDPTDAGAPRWSAVAPPPQPADITSLSLDGADLLIAAGPELQSLRLEPTAGAAPVCAGP